MAPTPSSSCSRPPAKDQHPHHPTTPSKTPMSKHRLHFTGTRNPNPGSAAKENAPTEHPVEVIGRIRDHPEKKERSASALDVSEDGRSLRLRTDVGYRDFSLDGVSVAEDEDLGGFYRRFVESRVRDVRLGAKCTVMMYGPTGSGKSHTMFGCSKQPGIVYRALRDILCSGEEEKGTSDVDDGGFGSGMFVQVAVLEIYNEEIYDLLSGCNGGGGGGVALPKGNTPKVRLEVMGKKAKNASHITGNEAGKISREVAKIEKRRIVKSTLCNERSSRSHCLIILDAPTVGGRLMLVDMAGSENIEQAGQIGFEAKMQTAKINQGNTALKRVVESIANGDSHVPFRDSKLTMLLQDSFEDDKSKILMILCASPDSKEMHKTMSTLEYGAKAKCIVRAAPVPTPKDKTDGSVILGSRITAMNQFICKLQMENKQREKERDEARKELTKKEDEVAGLRVMLKAVEGRKVGAKDEEINTIVDEKTKLLRVELKRMEERVVQQESELEALRQKLQVVGVGGSLEHKTLLPVAEMVGSRFMKRLSETVSTEGDGEEDRGMEKSMDLEDMGDVHEVREVVDSIKAPKSSTNSCPSPTSIVPTFPQRFCLSTVFEGNEEEEEEEEEEEGVRKEVVQEDDESRSSAHILNLVRREMEREREEQGKDSKQSSVSRNARIQNIFRLCGNHREMAHHVRGPSKDGPETEISHPKEPALSGGEESQQQMKKKKKKTTTEADKENRPDAGEAAAEGGGLLDVYVKWESSGEAPGNLIERMKVLKSATLSDLRKLIEANFGEENRQQQFTFLLLGDPTGAPVVGSKEASVLVTQLPVCNNQVAGGRHHLACLRLDKKSGGADPQHVPHLPLAPRENKIQSAAAAVNSTPPSAGRCIAQC